MGLLWFLVPLALVLLGAGVHWLARRRAAAILALPDPYPLDVLLEDVPGEETTVVTPDGARLRAVADGTGPTVVFAHGYGINRSEWNVIARRLLAEGYRVVAFNQRGHAGSTVGSEGVGSRPMAADYRAVLEHYDVRDAVLVGHSMGGFLAQVFLLTYPEVARERLRGVILFATFAGNAMKGAPQNRLQLPLIRHGIMARLLTTCYGVLFGASLLGEPRSPAMISCFLRAFGENDHRLLIPILLAFAREDYYSRLHEIDMPCVVICGEQDHTTPHWHSEAMGRLIPGARTIWVQGKGHLLNWEAPESVIEAVHSLTATPAPLSKAR